MVETVKPTIPSGFINRITDQARYLEGDLSEYLFKFGIRKGMVVLELGSCLGLHAEKIGHRIYPGYIISLEKDRACALFQQDRINHGSNIAVIQGDAHLLPIRNETCDFVYSRFLFQHLCNPRKVLTETRRILKNQGRIIIVDTDDHFDTFYPPLPSVLPLYAALAKLQALRGGDRYIGRKLFTYLADTGYHDIDVTIMPTVVLGKKNQELITKDIIPMFMEER